MKAFQRSPVVTNW